MTKYIQIEEVSKEELISLIESSIEKKFNQLQEEAQPQTLTVQEVSKLLSVSELTVYNYIKKGLLKASKVGRKHIIKRVDLESASKEVKSLNFKR